MIRSKLDNIIKKNNEYICNIDSKSIVVKYIVPLGYLNNCVPTGYAHLLEHLYIKSNYRYLEELEGLGVQFNGVTKERYMEIILIDPSGEIIEKELNNYKLDNLFKSNFTNKDLEIEKNTIIQEHKILQKNMSYNDVNIMLGSIDEIKNFELDILNNFREDIEKDIKKIVFKNLKNNSIHSANKIEWVRSVNILEFFKGKDSVKLVLEDDFYARILIYVIKILLDSVYKLNDMKINNNNSMITVVIPVSYDRLIDIISNYKINSYNRYKLKLEASFKFLSDEVTYLVNHFHNYRFINELYYLDDWENILYEKNN